MMYGGINIEETPNKSVLFFGINGYAIQKWTECGVLYEYHGNMVIVLWVHNNSL